MYCYNCMRDSVENGICRFCKTSGRPDCIPHHIKPGTILNNKYVIGNALGEGGFGITYVGRDLTLDIKVAVKEFYPSGYANRNNERSNSITLATEKQREFFQKGKERFLYEARSLARFSGEKGVVFVREYFESNKSAYIVMEYLDGINLSEYLQRNGTFEAEKIFRLMLPIMSSLEKMHSEGIIHRDISPDNVMYLKDGTLKLMDFGSARFFTNGEKEMSVMVKQGYAPEEQYRRNGNQGPWTDVYGLCATIYSCITGKVPEGSLNRQRTDTLKPPSEMNIRISPQLESVLMYGLAPLKENRCPNMTRLKELTAKALDNPYSTNTKLVDASFAGIGADAEQRGRLTYGDDYNRKQSGGNQNTNQKNVKQKKSAAAVLVTIIVVLLLAGIGTLAYFLINPHVKTVDGNSESTSATEMTVSATEVTEATEKPVIKMPNLIGMDKQRAIDELAELNLSVSNFPETESDESEPGKVFSQVPKEGTVMEPDTSITLYIAKERQTEAPTQAYKSTAHVDTDDAADSGGTTLYCRTDGYLTLRDTPSRGGKELARIKTGEPVTYLDSAGAFYKVRYNGTEGYALEGFLFSNPSAPLIEGKDILYCRAGDKSQANDRGFVNLRSSPSTEAQSKGEIHMGESVGFIKAANSDFIEVCYNGIYGYVLAKYFEKGPDAPLVYGDN